MTISGLVGVSWPWKNGVPQFEYDEDVINQAIVDILFTTLGERKMNTDHGSEVIRLVFENQGLLLVALARREITVALNANLSVINVLNVDVIEAESDNGSVDIQVTYEYLGVRKDTSVSISTEG
jgi:phage baseplate assembly protein W